jgi:hypothetical protein
MVFTFAHAREDLAADNAQLLLVVKKYLVDTVQKMDAAGHDFVTNAAAYQAIIDNAGGDYNKAASEHGVELGELVKKCRATLASTTITVTKQSKALSPARRK